MTKAVGDAGIIEAIPSVFMVQDSYDDTMRPGAFAESIKRKLPAVLWMHNGSNVIGKTLEARELPAGDALLPEAIRDFGGLYCKGQLYLDETPSAKLAYKCLQDGVVNQFSIGYYEEKVTREEVDGEEMRYVERVDLVEWSPVHRGANPSTELLDVKDKNIPPRSIKDQIEQSQADLKLILERVNEIRDKRSDEGRDISPATLEALVSLSRDIDAIAEAVATRELQPAAFRLLSEARTLQMEMITNL